MPERRSQLNLNAQFNIVEELLEKNVRSSPNNMALYLISPETLQVEQAITYDNLERHVNLIGNALAKNGVEREQRVAVMLNDGLELVSTFLASMKIGAVPILFSTHFNEEHLLFLLNDSRAKALFIGTDIVDKLHHVKPKLEFTEHFISEKKTEDTVSYDEFLRGFSDKLDITNTSKDDIAFWFFTSGSTGIPKGVIHLHHDLYYAGLTYYDDVLHANQEDRFLSGAKLFFSAGLGFGLYGPLIMGASTILYPGRPSASTMLSILQNAKPTAFLAVPTLYAQISQLPEFTSADLSSVRVFATGGESLSPRIFEDWKAQTGLEITEAVGSAEVGHHYISNTLGKARPNTCGRLMEGYEAKIVDDEGKELGPNQIGKLLVKGESTFVCYWHMHEATKKTIIGEWINTGDLFYRDDESYFHFCGRADFSFKIHGLWVSPIEIENAIIDTRLVSECCVVSIEGLDGISIPIAYLVPKEKGGNELQLESEITKRLERKLSKYKIPRKYVFVQSLQKTNVEKIDRSAILKRARESV
ncbi:MAG: benzoate-CoA ligase family protein [Nitrososphaerota archaeon]|nr:benzoate-CoA ligase family protein [Nitrososphaerota archaeon]